MKMETFTLSAYLGCVGLCDVLSLLPSSGFEVYSEWSPAGHPGREYEVGLQVHRACVPEGPCGEYEISMVLTTVM